MSTIRLYQVLDKWDKIEKGNTDQSFSIEFVQKDGTLRYFKRAVKCGAKFNLRDNEMRGCIPVDEDGNRLAHPVQFGIRSMISFNGQKIVL
jgi:hypothetical protein